MNFLTSLYNLPKSQRPIVWTEPWYSDGYNNIRYTCLLERFKSVQPVYQFRRLSGLRGRLTKIYEASPLGRYWYFGLRYSRLVHELGKHYQALFCTGHLTKIRHFPGPVIVDEDDPVFSPQRMAWLNDPRVVEVVTSTDQLREQLCANGLRKKCSVIPSGVDFSTLDPQEARRIGEQWGKNPENVIVGYAVPEILTDQDPAVVRSSGEKLRSVSFLLEVMEIVWQQDPSVQLWLAGRPSPAVKAWAAAHPQTTLLGYIPHFQLLNHMANFDIAVYPRQADFGGRHSIKLLEFMACRIPIVATPVAESFLVEDARCGLFASDAQTFAGHILQLAGQPGLRQALGQNALARARLFDWDLLAARYEDEIFLPLLKFLPKATAV